MERDLKNPEIVEGYLMTTEMIKEAWARYRPVQNEQKGKDEEENDQKSDQEHQKNGRRRQKPKKK